MTTPNHHEPFDAEPFSDEEREFAARLGRMGPVDGPSPALDAKILAAAHAASAPRIPAKRHRLAWLGVPPALVTGAGVAAAAVLVLGVVWQLRPQYGSVTARSEADAGEEIILIAPPADKPVPQVADAAAAPERRASSEPARSPQPRTAPPAAARTVSVQEPVAQAAASAPPPAAAPAAANEAGSLAPTASAAPEAFSGTADAAADARPLEDGYTETRERHATYTTAARAEAERRGRSAAQKASASAREAAAAAEEESTTLDRVEVTGSRISGSEFDVDWADIPLNDDTHLAPVEWLERIRARRAGGDDDNARASLKMFQREYPRIRLPDDLRAFAEAKQ